MADTRFPLLLEPETFEQHRLEVKPLLLDLGHSRSYTSAHVPGALHLEYAGLVAPRPPAQGMLPALDDLSRLFSGLGLTEETTVVAYDNEGGGKAGRLIWTLHLLGHDRCSVLHGGLQAWRQAGYPVETQPTHYGQPADYRAKIHRSEILVDKEYILKNLENPDVVLLDTRTPDEYSGHEQFAQRAGHIPGAVNLNWTLTLDLDRDRGLRWQPEAALRAMLDGLGVLPEREIIVYCQTHHRSSHLYVVLKALGYPRVRGYAGSWSEWGNLPHLPIEEDGNRK